MKLKLFVLTALMLVPSVYAQAEESTFPAITMTLIMLALGAGAIIFIIKMLGFGRK